MIALWASKLVLLIVNKAKEQIESAVFVFELRLEISYFIAARTVLWFRWANCNNTLSLADHERYYEIMPQCNEVITLNTHYSSQCYAQRNQYMVDRSNRVICCWNEFGEGSYIEPTKKDGFSYLEKVKKVFGSP